MSDCTHSIIANVYVPDSDRIIWQCQMCNEKVIFGLDGEYVLLNEKQPQTLYDLYGDLIDL